MTDPESHRPDANGKVAMRLIAITGHVNVSDEIAEWVRKQLTTRLPEVMGSGLRGITCLAKGADQLFARVVVELRGTFEVVLPARDYEQRMVDGGDGDSFCALLGLATRVHTMPFERSSRAAYLAASEDMLSRCDLLLAVWDGAPSRSVGDTADVVQKARALSVPVEVLWPPELPDPPASGLCPLQPPTSAPLGSDQSGPPDAEVHTG